MTQGVILHMADVVSPFPPPLAATKVRHLHNILLPLCRLSQALSLK
ncbi:hypothetical protein [Intestinirhabdus alba]|jgi:hypothetical protein|uniref:Uncharacterized protein n=1 Tax=Intestinirhabdus alba TaxID=2899544 RepID=A0A6L6IGR1_9ENTR|nr:hypothetical protein [Intestinirhabdus alba]MTH44816.1 hypothetical protein [Intestinirhabdus alba]